MEDLRQQLILYATRVQCYNLRLLILSSRSRGCEATAQLDLSTVFLLFFFPFDFMAFTSGMWYEMGMFISNPITSRLFEFWGRKRRICEAQPTSITSGSIFTQHNCGEIGSPQQDTNVKHDSDISSKDMTLLKLE